MDTTLTMNEELVADPSLMTDPPAVALRNKCLLEKTSPLILLLLAILATLPGWLPRRVYVPAAALTHPNDPTWLTTFAGQQIRRGELPLWNPNAGLGEPLLAKGNLGGLAPTILPHLLKNPTWSWTISATLKLWIAGLGVWFLAGRYGLHGLPRLFAGAMFMLCGFITFNLTDALTSAMCWLPWCVLVVEQLVDRVTLLRIIVAALVFAAQFLVGAPAASLAVLLTCGAILLLNLVYLKPLPTLAAIPAALLAAGIGLGIAGVQWLPLWDYAANFGPPAAPALRWSSAWVGVIPLLLAVFAIVSGWRGHRVVMLSILAVSAAACILVTGNLLPHPLRTPDLCMPLIASAVMFAALLSGFGLAHVRSLIPWNADQAVNDFRAPWLFAAVGMVELLGVAIYIHRGVPVADYTAAEAAAAQAHATRSDVSPIGRLTFSGAGAVPRVWFVGNSSFIATKKDLETKVADPSFAPQSIALFVKENLSDDNKEWVNRAPTGGRGGGPGGGGPGGGPRQPGRGGILGGAFGIGGGSSSSRVEVLESSPNHLRVQTPAGGNGWLVISEAYGDGWTAKAAPVTRFGRGAVSTEHIVLPAYGSLRAAEVDGGATDLLIEYKPVPFRHGLIVTSATAILVVLMLGCALMRKVSA